MTTPPDRLYTRSELFGDWSADDPRSWAESFDGRTYLAGVRQGLRSPMSDQVAMDRALHDSAVTRLVHDRLWATGCRPAAIMGGHAAERGGSTYRAAAHLAAGLSRRGLTVLTGGGPGAMEAGHLGARLALCPREIDDAVDEIAGDATCRAFPIGPNDLVEGGRWVPEAVAALHHWQKPAFALAEATDDVANDTVGIPTWLYGHEPPTPLATQHGKYFENSIREDGLLALAIYGVIYLPGSAGTLQEVFQDLAQNHYRTVRGLFSPMVFVDLDRHWSERFPIRPVIEALLRPEDRERVLWTGDVDEAVEFVASHQLDMGATDLSMPS